MPVISPSYASFFAMVGNVDKTTHRDWCTAVEAALASVPSVPLANSDLDTAPAETVKGNPTGSTGSIQDITFSSLKALLNFSAADISGLGPLASATEVTNADLADMADQTVKGNLTGSTGLPVDVTLDALADAMRVFGLSSRGLVPGPNATAVANGYVLFADGTWAQVTGPGMGDVVGPFGATDGQIVLFDGTTGKILKSGAVLSATGAAIVAASDTKTLRAAAGIGDTNFIINGDFQINQRGHAGSLSAGAYGIDRWKASAAGSASVTVSGLTVSLASGELEQVIQPSMFGLGGLASQTITVSVDSPSANMTVSAGASATGTINAGAGRQSVTLTLAAGDTGNVSVKLKRATAGTVTFSRVKVELGANATPWVARPLADELDLAQSYFVRFRPAANARFNGQRISTNFIRVDGIPLPRALLGTISSNTHSSPTWVTSAPGAANSVGFVLPNGTYATISGALTATFGPSTNFSTSVIFQAGTSFSGTAGDFGQIQFGSGFYLDFGAEL